MSDFDDTASLFGDGKAPGALRTIGEVSAALGIKPHVLRYWEDQFPQLSPLKRAGGRRLYRPQDVALLAKIDRLVNRDGYTLKGARAALGGDGGPSAPDPGPVPAPAMARAPAPAPDPAPVDPLAAEAGAPSPAVSAVPTTAAETSPRIPADLRERLLAIRAQLAAALAA